MFEVGVVRASGCKPKPQIRKQNREMFSIFFYIKVYCVFSLESPHIGDSNEYTRYTIFNLKKENHPKLSQIRRNGIFATDSRTSSKQR